MEVNLILHLLVKPATICSERDTLPDGLSRTKGHPHQRRALLPVLQKRNFAGVCAYEALFRRLGANSSASASYRLR